MGVASLVIGIIAFFVSLIPLCGYVASIPAATGLVLGTVFLIQAKKREETNTGTAIAGVVLNLLALIVLVIYTIIFSVIGGSKDSVKQLFQDAISDSAQVEHDSVAKEIEQELTADSSEPNPFEMGGTDADDSTSVEPQESDGSEDQ